MPPKTNCLYIRWESDKFRWTPQSTDQMWIFLVQKMKLKKYIVITLLIVSVVSTKSGNRSEQPVFSTKSIVLVGKAISFLWLCGGGRKGLVFLNLWNRVLDIWLTNLAECSYFAMRTHTGQLSPASEAIPSRLCLIFNFFKQFDHRNLVPH